MITLHDINSVTMSPTPDEYKELKPYSHSMLNSIAQCPTLGIVTYVQDRVMSSGRRAMALEAGSAAHEVFAAARLWQIIAHQDRREHAEVHGPRIFGAVRYNEMINSMEQASEENDRQRMMRFCLEALYTSGFYDDPDDKRRTITNLEEALIAYLDRYDWHRNVWLEGGPEDRIGIEIPLDTVVQFDDMLPIRLIGTADGVVVNSRGELRLEENKTAARLDDAWRLSFDMSHQITSYMMMLSTLLGQTVADCTMRGMALPLPRNYAVNGIMAFVVRRNETQMKQFLEWLLHLVQLVEVYGDDPANAPKHTGSCNKYFRPCSLIPYCTADAEDKDEFLGMMAQREQTPSERAIDGEAE